MSNTYRIYPTLWNDGGGCEMAQTVYAVDRQPPPNTFGTCCSRRTNQDPAYYWDTPTFQRLLPPPTTTTQRSVTWSGLPSWFSYVQSLGYTIVTDVSSLRPYTDIYISGP